ncbi:MAG: aminotransferase class IV [Phycisphaerales bacterium]|nr:aminotransferase class IV [Phycisphaerales bacterium]
MIVHLNGRLLPRDAATISVFDRGFIFGDGMYEGLRAAEVTPGRPGVIGLDQHVERMREGLAECRIDGFDPAALGSLSTDLLEANGLTEAFVYWQVTRGAPAPGQPVRTRIPIRGQTPTVFGYAVSLKPVNAYSEPEARSAAVRPDTRWLRGHVKATSLLGGVLAAIEADEQGCDDAVMVRDGLVTEGTSTNVFIARGDRLITPSIGSAPMLGGVTRQLILNDAPDIESRPVTERELREADEIMLVGTITMVASIVKLDGRPVGGGRVGPQARRLLDILRRAIDRDLGRGGSRTPNRHPAAAEA